MIILNSIIFWLIVFFCDWIVSRMITRSIIIIKSTSIIVHRGINVPPLNVPPLFWVSGAPLSVPAGTTRGAETHTRLRNGVLKAYRNNEESRTATSLI